MTAGDQEHDATTRGRDWLGQLLDFGSAALLIWLTFHPEAIEDVHEQLERGWGRVRHRVSVWAALGSIRTLPETPMHGPGH